MRPAKDLHDVVRIIDELCARAIERGDRVGYFAALYRHVAVKFAWAIAQGEFADPVGMERLDVVFFNRYLAALDAWQSGAPCSRSWEVAFQAAASQRPIVLQHLFAGMNAHINYDLGIAVADSVERTALPAFQADFDKMNDLLASLLGGVMDDLTKVWPLLRLLNRVGGRLEDEFVNFSMRSARALAWDSALALAAAGQQGRAAREREMDLVVAELGAEIVHPPFPVSSVLALVRAGEQGSVADVIRDLLAGSGEPPSRDAMTPRRPAAPPDAASDRASAGGPGKRRVIVLGSGQSAMTAAFQLTHPKNPRAGELDVAVFQLGWRLGGKGATGRNPTHGYRIEEHGLHNWFGFYDNCFRQIKDCYAELGRAPDAPLSDWKQAFHPANEAIFTEEIDGKHLFWKIQNFPNDAEPGTGGLLLPLWDYALMMLEALESLFSRHAEGGALHLEATGETDQGLALAASHGASIEHGPTPGHDVFGALLELARRAKDGLETELRRVACDLLAVFMRWLWSEVRPVVRTDTSARRLWILANFGYACLVGMLEEGVFERGFDVLNDYNFRAFIAKYAIADDGTLLSSPVVRAVYDSSFAYRGGDTTIAPGEDHPAAEAFEAGTALRGMVRSLFTYKGAFGYRFAAGTADTCYAPMYEVMKRRGVKFHFFHRVVEVECDEADPKRPVVRVRIAEQVEITDAQKKQGGYQPFIMVKGLPCWPSSPQWEQIVGGEALRQSGINLECPPKSFVDVREIVLERGRDFDDVVLGISIAALPWLCPSLVRSSEKWRTALKAVKTVRTQALQLWLTKTSTELGFPFVGAPIASWDYDRTNSLNVWGDLTEIVPFEGWPVSPYPLNLAYYTSTFPDTPGTDPDAPLPPCFDCDAQADKVRVNAQRLIEDGLGVPWPGAFRVDAGKRSFDWDLLVDLRPGRHVGSDRLDAQFFKANVALSERYVLSVPGSSKHRLAVHDDEEFANLYLTGDWTWCGLNVGAMESATMSGMLCSLALSGFPTREDITGVDFGH